MADVAESLNVVRNALAGNRYRYLSEKDLQAGLAAALAEAGLDAHREQQITGGRIDFLVNLGLHVVGVEVKVKGNVDALRRQIERYAEDVGVHALLIVTTAEARDVAERRLRAVSRRGRLARWFGEDGREQR